MPCRAPGGPGHPPPPRPRLPAQPRPADPPDGSWQHAPLGSGFRTRTRAMNDPAYAAFFALDPFFAIVMRGLAGLVDGDHYFDTIAADAVFEFRYRFPGYPTKVAG